MSRLLDDMYKSKKDRVKQELLDASPKSISGLTYGPRPIGTLSWRLLLTFLTAKASTSRAYWHSDASSGAIAVKTSP